MQPPVGTNATKATNTTKVTSTVLNDCEQHAHYKIVERAITYLVANQRQQPSLEKIAQQVGLSESRLQRVFTDWAGVSPKQFLQFLTKEHAKSVLAHVPVLDAALASGLSGSSRLHDLMVRWESITPGEYKKQGAGLTIEYGAHSSPFGFCFMAVTARGLCKLAFYDNAHEQAQLEKELQADWPNATLVHNPIATQSTFKQIFAPLRPRGDIKLLLKGTPFRLQVWEALLNIPQGQLHSYQQVADAIGKPNSVRAVASAIASNHIGYVIPCHRVIRGTGVLSEYRWGASRKRTLIGWEHAKSLGDE